jgi:hypothetical protein
MSSCVRNAQAWLSCRAIDKRCFAANTKYEYPRVRRLGSYQGWSWLRPSLRLPPVRQMRFQLLRAEPEEKAGVVMWSREAVELRDLHERVGRDFLMPYQLIPVPVTHLSWDLRATGGARYRCRLSRGCDQTATGRPSGPLRLFARQGAFGETYHYVFCFFSREASPTRVKKPCHLV